MNVTSETRKSDVDWKVANIVGSLHCEWRSKTVLLQQVMEWRFWF